MSKRRAYKPCDVTFVEPEFNESHFMNRSCAVTLLQSGFTVEYKCILLFYKPSLSGQPLFSCSTDVFQSVNAWKLLHCVLYCRKTRISFLLNDLAAKVTIGCFIIRNYSLHKRKVIWLLKHSNTALTRNILH